MTGDELKIVEAVEERSGEIVELASELIAFDTTVRGDPDEPARAEAALQERLAELLSESGAEVELWEPAPGDLDGWQRQVPLGLGFAGRPQMVAKYPGTAAGRSMLFNGHIDVVSGEPRGSWTTDPFAPEVRDGLLYGRGASDMKGGVAAMVVAAMVLADQGVALSGDLIVNTVTDEEWNGAGALAAVAHGVNADAALIPESSGFDPWIACRGVLNPTITITGRPGHAEMPQPDWREGGAVNAIEKAVLVLEAIRELREEWSARSSGHPLLEPGALIPTMIDGGEWWVTYPASCRTVIDITYLPEQGDDEGGWGAGLEKEIEEWVTERTRSDPWLAENPPEFEWATNLAPAEIRQDHPLVEAVLGVGSDLNHPGTVGAEQGWHDAATFTLAGTPAISYGASYLAADGETTPHAIDEHVPVNDLITTAKAYALTAMRWAGEGAA